MHSFTNYKDMIGGKIKKTGHVTLTTPILGVICHRRLGFETVYNVYMHAKFDDSSFSRSRDITGASKFKVGHVALTTLLLRAICHPYAGLDIGYMHAKFDHSSFIRSEDVVGAHNSTHYEYRKWGLGLVRGHSRSLEIAPFDRADTSSY